MTEDKTFFVEQEVLYEVGVTSRERIIPRTYEFILLPLILEPSFRFPCGELVPFRAVREFKFDVENS